MRKQLNLKYMFMVFSPFKYFRPTTASFITSRSFETHWSEPRDLAAGHSVAVSVEVLR